MFRSIRDTLGRSRPAFSTSLVRTLSVVGAAALFAACGDSSTDPTDGPEIGSVVQSVSATGASVAARSGAPPEDAAAPSASVTDGTTAMIPGGGGVYTITADGQFSVVFASVDGRDGYYEIDFGSMRSTAEVALAYGDELDENRYSLSFSVGTGNGAGAADTEDVQVVSVGTGDVQVSVAWNVPSDVDLYVVDPDGEEIYYGNRTSASGGELDLDSNAACVGDDVRNENITWPDGAPRGEYEVRVNYWSACGQERTDWVVTVRAGGQAQSFQGTFTGSGNGGGSGDGEVVTTFTF